MARQNVNKKDCEPTSVWKENKIPVLEFCSIERASQLLKCQESDIKHWIMRRLISPSVYIRNLTQVHATFFVNDKNISSEQAMNKLNELTGKPSSLYYSPDVIPHMADELDIAASGGSESGFNTALQLKASLYGLWELRSNFFNPCGDKIIMDEPDPFFLPYSDNFDENTLLICYPTQPVIFRMNELLLTRYEIEHIYRASRSGNHLKNTRNNPPELKEGEHYTQKKAQKDRIEIQKAINKLLALYPSIPSDKDQCYRTRDGKLIKDGVARLLDLHESTLFDGGKSPLKLGDTLRDAVGEYLKTLGWNGKS